MDYLEENRDLIADTIKRGGYSLLLGAGASMKCTGMSGVTMLSGNQLRDQINLVVGLPAGTPLNQGASLLDQDQTKDLLTVPFTTQTIDPGLNSLARYVWRHIFTFNIDDVVEAIYEQEPDARQEVSEYTFKDLFSSVSIDKVQVVHLHGSVRKPHHGYVFSMNDYASVMKEDSAWMPILGNLIATDPFVISGTSLSEIDLQYYIKSHRPGIAKKHSAPSLLVEPYPNALTRKVCQENDLILVEKTFQEFMTWLGSVLPVAPLVSELLAPKLNPFYGTTVSQLQFTRFYLNFQKLESREGTSSTGITPFYLGAEISDEDLWNRRDVERRDNMFLYAKVTKLWDELAQGGDTRLALVADDYFTGKSTLCKRVAMEFAKTKVTVFQFRNFGIVDQENTILCLSRLSGRILVYLDNFADCVDQFDEIMKMSPPNVFFLASERKYRLEHIRNLLTVDLFTYWPKNPDEREISRLVEVYRDIGVVGTRGVLDSTSSEFKELLKLPIGVAACVIMNDFRPLDAVADSLVDHTPQAILETYLIACIAGQSFRSGIEYSLLQSIHSRHTSVAEMFEQESPIGLRFNADNEDYVLPSNGIMAGRIVEHFVKKKRERLMGLYVKLALGLAPYVNRQALKDRSPFARLASGLFQHDSLEKSLGKELTILFYEKIKPRWEWNSRYWEQVALHKMGTNIGLAIQHARHAVVIEEHPFTMTTLSRVLIEQMRISRGNLENIEEVIALLSKSVNIETDRGRQRVQPISTLIYGLETFQDLGGTIDRRSFATIRSILQTGFSNNLITIQSRKKAEELLRLVS